MFNEKKVSRKEFLKYLMGALFSFLCVVKLPRIDFAKNVQDSEDANNKVY